MANTIINTPELLDFGSSTGATILPKGASSERPPSANIAGIDYLVVAGGGGGGTGVTASTIGTGGGGGAGGLRTSYGSTSGGGSSAESSLDLLVATNYTVTVGTGGNGGTAGSSGATNGQDSVFSSITSVGGGAAGSYRNPTSSSYYAQVGGSGGGSTYRGASGTTGADGTANQGYKGGNDLGNGGASAYGAGGGGGASAVGVNGNGTAPGGGGNGLAVAITGSSVTYAGGGGAGGVQGYTQAVGGAGGGGAGGVGNGNAGTAGTANTGGGGGGGGKTSASGTLPGSGADGGSGIVILRYASTITITVGSGLTTGVLNATVSGSTDKYTTFTSGTGTITFANSYSGPFATEGDFRFNTDANKTEFYNGTSWKQIVDEYASGFVGPGTNYFDTKLYTGNGSTQSIVGLNFQPGLTWVKARDAAHDNLLVDSVNGAGSAKGLVSNATYTQGEYTATYGYISSLNSNGFTVASGSSYANYTNVNNEDYVSWNWKAGGTAVTNNDGTVASQVSANKDSGFSIVTNTSVTGNYTWGHGLTKAPELWIHKPLNYTYGWETIFPKTFGVDAGSLSASDWDYMLLNSSAAKVTNVHYAANDSVLAQVGGGWGQVNNFVTYCWHSVAGYSKIGTYTWTNPSSTTGTMVSGLGFTPSFVIIKSITGGAGDWQMYDNRRVSGATQNNALYADLSDAESTSGYQAITFDADGFSAAVGVDGNQTASQSLNNSGWDYLYMAIA